MAAAPHVVKNAEFEAKHHRGAHGRFGAGITKPKLLKRDERAVAQIGEAFAPRRIGSPQHAAEYTAGIRQRIHPDTVSAFHDLARALRRGDTSDERIGKLDAAMAPTEHDLVLTRHVSPQAFGLKDAHLPELKQLLAGRKIVDRAYTPGALHQEPQPGGITMHIAVPKGTRALVAGDNEMWLDRNSEFAVHDVYANGHGGYDVHMTVLPKAAARPAKKAKATANKPPKETTSERAGPEPDHIQFSETLATKIAKTRASLPKDRAGWAALVPQTHEDRARYTAVIRKYEAKVAEHAQARNDAINQVYEKLRRRGWKKADVLDQVERRGGEYWGSEQFRPLRDLDAEHQQDQQMLDMYRRQLAMVNDSDQSKLTAEYPLDPSGRKMPTAAQHEHLDRVLAVGKAAHVELLAAFDRDPQLSQMRNDYARADAAAQERSRLLFEHPPTLPPRERNARLDVLRTQVPSGTNWRIEAQQAIRRREQEILREILASHRPMGGRHERVNPMDEATASDMRGVGDSPVRAARPDWRERIDTATGYFPADWVRTSSQHDLNLASTDRAFQLSSRNVIAMSSPERDKDFYDGAFADDTDEVTVHELGHRMEQYIPGLTDLEFTFVRRRSTNPSTGELEPTRKMSEITGSKTYADYEVAFPDEWAHAYAGKTYEGYGDPARTQWEVFQVGLQDLYGRGSRRFDKGDELQAFTLGVLLTLGTD